MSEDAPMFVVKKMKVGELEKYCVVLNSALDGVIAHGPSEFEVEMVCSKLNDTLWEAIAEVVFNCANCQGEVV